MLTPQHRKILLGLVVAAVILSTASVLLSKPSRRATSGGGVSSLALGIMPSKMGVAQDGYAEEYAYGDAGMAPSAPMMARSAMMPYPVPEPSAGRTAAETDQKIIKNGFLNLVVDKVEDAAARISALAVRRGGFVQSSSITERGDGTYYGDVSVRVPAKEFESSMAEIKTYATLVKHETATGQDVTEQYTDLEAQLRNARAQEETYLAILKRAQTVEDILKVQERLGMIRAQIESLQGRLQYLENVTAYSTISVSLAEEPVVRVPTKEFRPLAIVKEAARTLVAAFQGLIAGLIWIVIVWGGILLPIALIAWLIWRAWKRRSAKRR